MTWLGKLMGKKKNYPKDSQFKLCIVDETKEHLHEILGITEARADELARYAVEAYKNNDCLHNCLADITVKCNHENELVFLTLVTHRVIETHQSRGRLEGVLKDLFKRG